MKRFHFSLDKIMEIKQTEEKILQKNLVLVQTELFNAENIQEAIQHKLCEEWMRQDKMKNKVLSSVEFNLHHKYIKSLDEDIDNSKRNIQKLKKKVDIARNKLLDKTKERKTIEKLRDVRFSEYKKAVKKEEQNFLDEISIQSNRFKKVQEN